VTSISHGPECHSFSKISVNLRRATGEDRGPQKSRDDVRSGPLPAHAVMFLIDDTSALIDLIHFQQLIFLQDRIILENQRPTLLLLKPRAEIPTRADATSIAYRRWLKKKASPTAPTSDGTTTYSS
jgi:hypothetical protein